MNWSKPLLLTLIFLGILLFNSANVSMAFVSNLSGVWQGTLIPSQHVKITVNRGYKLVLERYHRIH